MNKRRLIMALLGLAWSTAAGATDILEAYRDAQNNDPVLGAARAGLEATQELIPQSRSALLPRVAIGGQTSWIERSTSVDFLDQDFNEHGWQAELRQPVFDLEAWFNFRSSQAGVEGAEWGFASVEQDLVVRTVSAYLNVLRAEALLESAEKAEEAVKRQLEQVQQRFDVGLVAITDVLEAQAGYDSSVVVRVQAAGDHDIFFETLRTLTGQPYDSIAKISDDLPIVDPTPGNEEEWVDTALAANPTILAATSQLEAAERTLQARRSGHLPTVDATLSHNHFVSGGTSFGGQGLKTDQDVYALSITLPIYQGGLTSSRAREARALKEQARQELLDRQLIVGRDTRNLFRAVATDVVRVRARKQAIASSESALEATQTGYEVGTRNIVDVLDAQNRLYASQFDYADSRYNYIIDLMLLRQAAGTLSGTDVENLNVYADPNDPVTRLNSLKPRVIN
ncbi:MAG: TolC family outer membrane protein [Pseudomonadales bacterium]|nr:TolC family outer membrane protein [Pseudomonadales bacterium]NIX07099.1 TolC family outer membrane protein [Pseudomonadales bacterium]